MPYEAPEKGKLRETYSFRFANMEGDKSGGSRLQLLLQSMEAAWSVGVSDLAVYATIEALATQSPAPQRNYN